MSGERKLTQTEPIKKKIKQTQSATSEKPIKNAIVLLEYDIIVLFVFFNGILVMDILGYSLVIQSQVHTSVKSACLTLTNRA